MGWKKGESGGGSVLRSGGELAGGMGGEEREWRVERTSGMRVKKGEEGRREEENKRRNGRSDLGNEGWGKVVRRRTKQNLRKIKWKKTEICDKEEW